MTGKPRNLKQCALYPLIGILSCVLILVIGLVTAKKWEGLCYLGAVWLLLFFTGYWKSCLKVLPFAFIVCGLFGGLTYLISRNISAMTAAVCRGLAVSVAVIPGLSMQPALLCRNLSQLKVSRAVTLGAMIAISFFPLLTAEIRQVREAMKTRGTGGMWFKPTVFYRAFMIPFIVRLVHISDTLSLSVETRGFELKSRTYTIYHPVRIRVKDIVFSIILLVLSFMAVL